MTTINKNKGILFHYRVGITVYIMMFNTCYKMFLVTSTSWQILSVYLLVKFFIQAGHMPQAELISLKCHRYKFGHLWIGKKIE